MHLQTHRGSICFQEASDNMPILYNRRKKMMNKIIYLVWLILLTVSLFWSPNAFGIDSIMVRGGGMQGNISLGMAKHEIIASIGAPDIIKSDGHCLYYAVFDVSIILDKDKRVREIYAGKNFTGTVKKTDGSDVSLQALFQGFGEPLSTVRVTYTPSTALGAQATVETERTVNAPENKAGSLPLEYRGNRKLYELYNGDIVLKYKYVLDDEGIAFWLDSNKQIYATVIYAATIAVKPATEAAKKTNFETIHFDFDSSMLKNEDITLLDKTVQIINDNESMAVIIEGHTDAIGTDDYNQKLSEQRANSVYNYFFNKGIPASRMKKIGYGLQKPVAENRTPDGQDNPEGRAKNRRVQLRSDTIQP